MYLGHYIVKRMSFTDVGEDAIILYVFVFGNGRAEECRYAKFVLVPVTFGTGVDCSYIIVQGDDDEHLQQSTDPNHVLHGHHSLN
ncbi:hypothetical protein Trydic_g8744 [Trypoxylus dichotomus]